MPFNTRKQKHVSRRNVLQRLATIGAAGPLVSACGRNAAIDDTDPFHGWQVGIAYWSLREFPVAAQLAITRGLGLDHYECTHALGGSNRTAPMDPAGLRTLMTDFGFTPHISYENFDEDRDRSRRLFDGAATLGLRTISTNSGSPAIYDTLESLAGEYDIRVGLHNHGPKDERHGKRDQVVAILRAMPQCANPMPKTLSPMPQNQSKTCARRPLLGKYLKKLEHYKFQN